MGAFLDFLYPANCVACNAPPAPLCDGCRPEAKPLTISIAEQPTFCAVEYSGVAEDIIRGFKDSKLVSLAPVLAGWLDTAVSLAPEADFLAFPPRNRKNFAKRGFHPIEFIADRSEGLAHLRRIRVRSKRYVSEQRELGRAERFENLRGALTLTPKSGRVLLIDDVITTGATLSELARSARVAGLDVVGSCAIAYSSGFSVLTQPKKGVVCS